MLTLRAQVLLAVLLAVPSSALASHPNLLFGAADLPRLRAQAQGTHQALYSALKSGTDSFLGTRIRASGDVVRSDGSVWYNLGDRRDIGDGLMVFSFIWQIDGGQQYLSLAQNWLSDILSWSTLDVDPTGGQDPHDLVQEQILGAVGFAYDVLYPTLSDAVRARARAVIQQNAADVLAAVAAGIWWLPEWLQNHDWINHAAVGLAALAVEGELPASQTDAWRAFATDSVHRIVAATSGINDGTWHEGISYLGYAYMWQLPYLVALQRVGHEDLTDFPLLHQAGRTAAHGLIPEQPGASILTYGDFFGFAMDLSSLRYAASRHQDGFAQWVANRAAAVAKPNVYAPEALGTLLQFLFFDPSVPEADVTKEPLDWFGDDAQAVIFRSGWDKGGTLFALKSGAYGGRSVWQRTRAKDATVGRLNWGHDHADDNGFYLYGNGTWLAPEAEGYSAEQASFTRFHNALTVDGEGQLGEGPRPKGDEDLAYPWFGSRQGSIPAHGSTAHFAYAQGEGAHLYDPALGLSRWDRHTLFIDRAWVVLRDVVESTKSHSYAWFCHFLEGAAQDGSWIHGKAQNGQALGVAVVAPASWTFGASKQVLPQIDRLNPNGYVWGATVTHPPQANADFLTALVPVAESSWSKRPAVAPLDPSARGAGLSVTDGGRVTAVLFGKLPTDLTQAGGYTLAGLSGVAESAFGKPVRALLVRGTRLEDSSRLLLRHDGAATMLEADGLDGEQVALSGDALQQATLYAPRAKQVTWNQAVVPFTRDGDFVTVNVSGSHASGGGGGGSSGPDPSTPQTPSHGSGCASGPDAGGLALAGLALAWWLRRRRP